jgi:hypothetical protein
MKSAFKNMIDLFKKEDPKDEQFIKKKTNVSETTRKFRIERKRKNKESKISKRKNR